MFRTLIGHSGFVTTMSQLPNDQWSQLVTGLVQLLLSNAIKPVFLQDDMGLRAGEAELLAILLRVPSAAHAMDHGIPFVSSIVICVQC
jgi:hypothetical protein